MTTFVLVPGAWHGAWCWERVVPLLEAARHRVITPELLGMGKDRAHAAQGSVPAWADQVAKLINQQGEPVVLAGHSRGGVVISEVAELVPQRISKLVYISAFLLERGATILTASSRVERKFEAVHPIPSEDGTVSLPSENVPAAFYNTSPPELAERAATLIGPEPGSSLVHPVGVTRERFGSVPRAYVECLQDRAVPITLQRIMQQTWPCEAVNTLDCDHSPFYSKPEALALALISIAQDAPADR